MNQKSCWGAAHPPFGNRAGARRGGFVLAALLFAAAIPAAWAATNDVLVNHDVVPTSATGPAGGDFSYQPIVVLNAGTSATNVALTEKMPLGVTLNSIEVVPAGQGTCTAPAMPVVTTAANQTIQCNLADITAPGVANGIRVKFDVTIPGVNTNWEALASASAAETDSDPSNNQNLPRNITTYDAADLGITLTAPANVTQFQSFDYTATVVNNGPSTVTGEVTVSFTVPSGITVSGAGSNGWTCTPNGGGQGTQLQCSHAGPTANGATLADLVIPATASVTGQVSASASVSGKTSAGAAFPDGQDTNNTDNVTVTIASDDVVNVSMTKSVTPATVDKDKTNNQVTFTLQPTRASGSVAPTAVQINDTLPAGFTFGAFTQQNGWDCSASSGNAIDCSFTGTAPAVGGTYPALKFTATVDGTAVTGTSITNTAIVGAGNESAGQDGDNSDTATVNLSDTVALTLAKTVSKSPIKTGEPFTFDLKVKNTGSVDVLPNQTITVVDHIPADITISGFSATAGGPTWACITLPATGPVDVTCTTTSGLVAGTSSTITLNATGTFTGTGSHDHIVNSASITGVTGRDFTQVDDNASVNVSENQVNLSIQKVADQASVATGDVVTYTLTVTNEDTTNPSTGIVVKDALTNLVTSQDACPMDVSGSCTAAGPWPNGGFVSATSTQGGICSASGGINSRSRTVTCNIATLAAGASATITIKAIHYAADGAQATTVHNTATVASTEVEDADSTDDSASADVDVTPKTNIQVFKEPSPSPAAIGEPVTYTVHVYNAGPSKAANVTLSDVLPANAHWIASGFDAGTATCNAIADDATGATLNCSWTAQLAPNQQFAVKYQLRSVHDAQVGDVLHNPVDVTTTTAETTLADNHAEADVTLKAADLDVLINMQHTADGLIVANHEGTEYTITVTNNGPSSYATDVKMVDVFPGVLDLNGQQLPSSAVFSFQGLTSVTSTRTGSTAGIADCTAPAVGATSGPLTCLFDKMAPGETITIKFKMNAESLPNGDTGTIFHNATVDIFETEHLDNGTDVLANNFTNDRTSARQTADTPLPEVADLALVKTASSEVDNGGAALSGGDALTFTLQVTNLGPDASSNAVVHDPLPQGLDFGSATGPGGDCTFDMTTLLISCPVGALAVNGTATFTIRTVLSTPYDGARPLVNLATVSGDGDPNPGNDSDDSKTEIALPPYVEVPTLGTWALLLLMGLVGLIGGVAGRRRKQV